MNDYSKMQTHRHDNNNITTGALHPIKEWTVGVPVEDGARKQLFNLANMSFIHRHVAVMPDVHHGVGSTVGSVIATDDVIIPASVGVDIGCGMKAIKLTLKASHLPDNLAPLRSLIEESIPHGRTDNGGPNDEGAWLGSRNPPPQSVIAWQELEPGYRRIYEKYPKIQHRYVLEQLCSMGGGNHFQEFCIDTDQNVWVMLHSGSRGIGNKIGQYFIEMAKKEMRRWHINLPDQDLAYLPEGSTYFKDYVDAVHWGQEYARINRELMMDQVLNALKRSKMVPKFEVSDIAVNCHHNYVNKEFHFGKSVWVTRKGAVSAKKDELGIIPGSMGAKSFIVRGLGNRESFTSCSHGAGRVMSRTKAKEMFTLKDHRLATEGVECRKDKDVIDETPGAYKSIDAVMAAQSDLVEVVATLKQVLCVKG